jgi:hypothetical protein
MRRFYFLIVLLCIAATAPAQNKKAKKFINEGLAAFQNRDYAGRN